MGFVKLFAQGVVFFCLFLFALLGIGYYLNPPLFSLRNLDDPSIPIITLKGNDGVDFKIHFQTFGSPENPPLLIIHGGPGNDFAYLLSLKDEFSDEYFVVFYDQRGTGLSPRVKSEELTADQMIHDFGVVVDHVLSISQHKEKKVNVIGHSWGAMLTTMFMSQFPTESQNLGKIVLCEPGFLSNEAFAEFQVVTNGFVPPLTISSILALLESVLESLHFVVGGYDMDYVWDYFFMSFVSKAGSVPGTKLHEYFCDGAYPFPTFRHSFWSNLKIPSSIKMDESGQPIIDFAEGVKLSFRRKILMLTGSCNSLIGIDFQHKFHKNLFHDIEIVEIQNSGHLMFENMVDSKNAIKQFFDE